MRSHSRCNHSLTSAYQIAYRFPAPNKNKTHGNINPNSAYITSINPQWVPVICELMALSLPH
eukprot:1186834-Prorocentrum_minimum.AAC.2